MFRLSGTEMWQVVTSAFCQLQALTYSTGVVNQISVKVERPV